MMAMFYKPRFVHRAYAWVRGRFWIPCPICKKGFAEHEWLAWRVIRAELGLEPTCIAYDGRRAAFRVRRV